MATFGLTLCSPCQSTLMTKTQAKSSCLLSDKDLVDVPFVQEAAEQAAAMKPAKFYLPRLVNRVALKKHGSLAALAKKKAAKEAKKEKVEAAVSERTKRLNELLEDAGADMQVSPERKSTLKRQLAVGAEDDEQFAESVWRLIKRGRTENDSKQSKRSRKKTY